MEAILEGNDIAPLFNSRKAADLKGLRACDNAATRYGALSEANQKSWRGPETQLIQNAPCQLAFNDSKTSALAEAYCSTEVLYRR
jgi:hypothetical protein